MMALVCPMWQQPVPGLFEMLACYQLTSFSNYLYSYRLRLGSIGGLPLLIDYVEQNNW